MNGDALGVAAAHVAGGDGAEQPFVCRPPEVVEAAEVADVGGAANGGRGVRAVFRVSADVNQSSATYTQYGLYRTC